MVACAATECVAAEKCMKATSVKSNVSIIKLTSIYLVAPSGSLTTILYLLIIGLVAAGSFILWRRKVMADEQMQLFSNQLGKSPQLQ